jgi:glycosyltransferase involved in cell wall biosynthesis
MLRLLRRACRRADLIFCLNTQELRFLVEQGWAAADRVHLLANAAPPSFIYAREYRSRAQRLLFVGQWLNMKGTRYLAEAFTQLLRQHPDLKLCCAGTLANAKTVLSSFPETVRNSVTVRPRVSKSELLEIHRDSDLFVFPTLSEGFSLALIEAMASGLPIVTTPVGASCDILQEDASVIFCAPHDAESLASRIAELLDDQARREELGHNAQQAARKFRPELVLREYAALLNQFVDGDIAHEHVMPAARAVEGD